MWASRQRAPLRAINSAGECHLHTVEVTGSNPVSPTISKPPSRQRRGFLAAGLMLDSKGGAGASAGSAASARCEPTGQRASPRPGGAFRREPDRDRGRTQHRPPSIDPVKGMLGPRLLVATSTTPSRTFELRPCMANTPSRVTPTQLTHALSSDAAPRSLRHAGAEDHAGPNVVLIEAGEVRLQDRRWGFDAGSGGHPEHLRLPHGRRRRPGAEGTPTEVMSEAVDTRHPRQTLHDALGVATHSALDSGPMQPSAP